MGCYHRSEIDAILKVPKVPNTIKKEGFQVSRRTDLVQNTGAPTSVWLPQYISVRLFRSSARLRRKLVKTAEIADYVSWLAEEFGNATPLPTREKLWELLAQRVSKQEIRGVEFGVAFGYGTDWWLKRLPMATLQWDGFDRFTGLPRSWRDLDAGAFGTDGRTPRINDQRVTWHVGDVEDTVKELSLDRSERSQFVILFDLDIFEPSLAAWQYIRDSLRPQDLLYFDEAYDADERRLLNEHVLPAGKYECIGATPHALGLQVVQMD